MESVHFDPGVEKTRACLDEISTRVRKWVGLRRYLPFSASRRGYRIRFRREDRILGLVSCNVKMIDGSRLWSGSALGIDPRHAFRLAFMGVRPVKRF